MKAANAHILTINGGSSSIKFALYQDGEPLQRGLHGKVDRIGLSGTNLTFHDPTKKQRESRKLAATDHKSVANSLIDWQTTGKSQTCRRRLQISGEFSDKLARSPTGVRVGQSGGTSVGSWHETYRACESHKEAIG